MNMQSRPLDFLDDCRPGVANSNALSVQEKSMHLSREAMGNIGNMLHI